jgi:hypothetical protein
VARRTRCGSAKKLIPGFWAFLQSQYGAGAAVCLQAVSLTSHFWFGHGYSIMLLK